MRCACVWLLAAGVCAAAPGLDGAAGSQSTPEARPSGASVALTFDDLPSHGPLPPGLTRVDIARSIIEALQRGNSPPVYGFMNARRVQEMPADARVLEIWRAAGFPLGNHAFSHMDLQGNSVEAFEEDVVANEPALRSLMGERGWQWFRFPYLHEGETPQKHRTVHDFLKKRGYRVAQVTLSFDDYAYNEPYARCLAKGESSAIDSLKQSFLARASDRISRGQESSRSLFGRDIKHVMLLHIGGFQTVMLPQLLDLLRQRGFALSTLEEAASDPAYLTEPERESNWNGTFLQQLTAQRREPADVPADDFFTKLGTICR